MVATAVSPIGVEVLDDPDADAPVVRRMLADIARANRWLGGTSAVTAGIAALVDRADRGGSLTLLDVGIGAGDLPLAAVRWAGRHRVTLQPVGLERHRAAAAMARDAGVPTVVACATRLPFRGLSPRSAAEAAARHEHRDTVARGPAPHEHRDTVANDSSRRRSPDIILMSQLLHHFDDDAAVAMLAEATTTARRGVIVADLRPSRLAELGFSLAGRVLRFASVTIDDGVTSLRRGRDAAALVRLARRAGARAVGGRDLSLGRVVVSWRTDR